jgi:hypothetical protein
MEGHQEWAVHCLRPSGVHRTRSVYAWLSSTRNVNSNSSCGLRRSQLISRDNTFIYSRLPQHDLVSPSAGEIWFSLSVLAGLLIFGLAIFFAFGVLPYWFKVHKNLGEILGCQRTPLLIVIYHPLPPSTF